MADINPPTTTETETETEIQQEEEENWYCHICDKQVSIETPENNIMVCSECKHGFVESLTISSPSQQPYIVPPGVDIERLRHRFHDVMFLLEDEIAYQLYVDDLEVRDLTLDLEERLLRMEVGPDRYVGNPGDYVGEAEFDAVLDNLAETDNGERRGAPPASKAVVEGLPKHKVELEMQCVVCRDNVCVGETVTMLPCGHGYHGDCILPWLAMRNNCPVCRFELVTDDDEYEAEKNRRLCASGSSRF